MNHFEIPYLKAGIYLLIKEGDYPTGRILADLSNEEGKQTKAPRRKLDLETLNANEIGEVEMGHFGEGKFDLTGLKYINTEPLGACIGLTLWHPLEKIGYIAHFAVSNQAKEGLNQVFEQIKTSGLKPSNFEARLFGGGGISGINTMGQPYYGDDKPQSQRLIKEIWEILVRDEVLLKETDLYGRNRRNITLNLETGEVMDYEEKPINIPLLNWPEDEADMEPSTSVLNIKMSEQPYYRRG